MEATNPKGKSRPTKNRRGWTPNRTTSHGGINDFRRSVYYFFVSVFSIKVGNEGVES